MENQIKQRYLDLHADRTSTHWMASNQFRLWFSAFALLPFQRLRTLGLQGTELAHATDHAGACPYRVQCRVARCDMGDRWHARAVAINRQIPGPGHSHPAARRNPTRCRRFTSHFSLLTFHPLSRLSRAPFLRQSETLTGLWAGCHVTTRRRSILDLNLCYLCYLLFKILFASFCKGGLARHCFATGRSQ